MAFQSTSRNISISGGVLRAECQDGNGNWRSSSLDLDQHLGNSDGEFSLREKNFSHSAVNPQLDGAMLSAGLWDYGRMPVSATFNLNLCVTNENGNLKFQKPTESLLSSGSCFSLEGSMLNGLCMGDNGRFDVSEIDLDNYYENSNGTLVSGGRNFSYSSRNISLVPSGQSVLLKAELKGNHRFSGDFWREEEMDLAICILVRNGSFVFEKHDGLFGRDGFFAVFFEQIPYVGLIVAGIQACAGNEDHAKRALAICAHSTIIITTMVIGGKFGGVAGAVLGAGISTPLAILVESEIAKTIKDPRIREEFEEATLGRYIFETLENMLTFGAKKYLARLLKTAAKKVGSRELREIGSMFGTGSGTSNVVSSQRFMEKVADALYDEKLPTEWKEEYFEDYLNRQPTLAKKVLMEAGDERPGGCWPTMSDYEGGRHGGCWATDRERERARAKILESESSSTEFRLRMTQTSPHGLPSGMGFDGMGGGFSGKGGGFSGMGGGFSGNGGGFSRY